jgi:hypothetical protein
VPDRIWMELSPAPGFDIGEQGLFMQQEDEHCALAQLQLNGTLADHLTSLLQQSQGKTRAVGR